MEQKVGAPLNTTEHHSPLRLVLKLSSLVVALRSYWTAGQEAVRPSVCLSVSLSVCLEPVHHLQSLLLACLANVLRFFTASITSRRSRC